MFLLEFQRINQLKYRQSNLKNQELFTRYILFYVITQQLLKICTKELYMNRSPGIIICGFAAVGLDF